ncbi:MAG TPA: type I polyketide synthase [Anaerolineae bacterium]|nr:type I polyketide synthase [Anaerolineae bacterium]
MTGTSSADELDQLKRALAALKKARARIDELEQAHTQPIAIIGIGCRLPGQAHTPDAFWRMLRDGASGMVTVPPERWDIDAYYDENPDTPGKMPTRFGGFVQNVDRFDPSFFGIAPREAHAMDPQQRLMLEVAWEALEDAAIVPARLAGSHTGVFIGIGLNDYGRLQVVDQTLDPTIIDNYFIQGNALCITPNRLSYVLDLHGPSMAIDSACSSSLVAVHVACQSLRNGESTLALAGGTNLMLDPANSISLTKFLAPDGRCKTFDARADGYARGEGAIVIVLKRLSQAIADGDRIYAVIRGSAVNQDGFSSGLTVPNGVAQEAMLRAAIRSAGIEPHQLDYIEAHGTGTALGDPIEANALGAVVGAQRPAGDFCAIGSVKTNIGHLEAAAGIAGLVKVALALKYGAIPPSLNFEKANPHIALTQMSLRVPTQLMAWPRRAWRSLAGVSSFGFGGTNAHIILEAPPERTLAPLRSDRSAQLLTLSAKSDAALKELAARYINHLTNPPTNPLSDLCYTANLGRSHFAHRLAVVAHSPEQLRDDLLAFAEGQAGSSLASGQQQRSSKLKVAFLFTGQGAQYVSMARQLYETSPTFRAALDQCDEVLRAQLNQSILSVLYPDSEIRNQPSAIDETAFTQPALFAVQYALAELWKSWGIEPAIVMGHSVGEYTAACVAGVFDLADGLKLIAARGRLMQALPAGGAMAAIFSDEATVAAAIEPYADRLSLAAINGPDSIVISGAEDAVQRVTDQFQARGVKSKRLVVSHAFHSPLMEPMLAEFEQVVRTIRYRAPRIPLVSNVTGQVWPAGAAPDAAYWRDHVRAPVRFADGMRTLADQGYAVFVEIGPHPTLLGLGKHCLPDDYGAWLPSLKRGQDDWTQLLGSLGKLYARGADVDWPGFERDYAEGRQKIALPTYAFQRERYWFKHGDHRLSLAAANGHAARLHPLLDEALRSPAISGSVYQSRIDRQRLPFLGDHRVRDTAVFPATAYIEMALAAAQHVLGPGRYAVEDMLIQQPLILSEDKSQLVQIVLSPDGAFQIHSASDGDAATWNLHAMGHVRADTDETPFAPASLAEAHEQCQDEWDSAAFYTALHELGMNYGAAFQGLSRVQRGARRALGHVHLPDALAPQAETFQLHPALLDACLQVLAAALAGPDDMTANSNLYLPIGLERCRVFHRAPAVAWSYATIRPDDTPDAESVTGDVTLFDADDQPVAEVTGMRLKRASRAALAQIAQRSSAATYRTEWLYEVQWQAQPRAKAPVQPGDWLIFADRNGIADALVRQLTDEGRACVLVQPGQAFARIQADRYEIDPSQPADFERLLQTVAEDQSLSAVIYLWSIDAEPLGEPAAQNQQLGLGSALYLAQALAKRPTPPRLWLVTCGAQSTIQPAAGPIAVHQSTLWGFRRTLALEQPALRATCLDLDPAALAADNAQAVCDEVRVDAPEDQIAIRNETRFAARLARAARSTQLPVRLDIAARGTLDSLVIQAASRRQPGPGEVEIEVRAAGLNFRDVLNALGLYPGEAGALGNECAGKIASIGAGVTGLAVGDDVIAATSDCFASFAIARAELVIRKPASLTYAEAAALPVAYLTADYGLNQLAHMKRGDRVLIHAATGGVGLAAVRLAQQVGAEIFATAGSPDKRALLQSLGVPHVMHSRTLDFADEIMRLTDGAGVDIVLNSLTDEFIPKSFAALKRGGVFLEIGKRGIWSHEQVEQLGRAIDYHVIYLGDVCQSDPPLIHSLLQRLADAAGSGALPMLPVRVFPLEQAQAAFRFMAQAKHVGKIVISLPAIQPTSQPANQPSIQPDASYLITGGLGGIGLRVAQWLIDTGAQHVVLMGRSPASDAARQALAGLERSGAQVVVAQADVAQADQVERVLHDIAQSMPPLRGVIHAAGTLADAPLEQQDWTRFAAVMGSKVDGAWNLHRLTRDVPLDFFVLFAAGAGLIGSAGQSNYAAANVFLDALAHDRQARGLPALSIDWGPWSEVGMTAGLSEANRERMARQGLGFVAPDEGVQALESALTRGAAQVAVLPIDWSRFDAQRAASPFFAGLLASAQAASRSTNAEGAPRVVQRLADAPPNQRKSILAAHVREQAIKVLGLSATQTIDPHQPLNELGLDSLMAVELRNALSASVDRKLPATLLFNYPTSEALTDFLFKEVVPGDEPALSVPVRAKSPDAAALEQLTEEEAEALLLQELAARRPA